MRRRSSFQALVSLSLLIFEVWAQWSMTEHRLVRSAKRNFTSPNMTSSIRYEILQYGADEHASLHKALTEPVEMFLRFDRGMLISNRRLFIQGPCGWLVGSKPTRTCNTRHIRGNAPELADIDGTCVSTADVGFHIYTDLNQLKRVSYSSSFYSFVS